MTATYLMVYICLSAGACGYLDKVKILSPWSDRNDMSACLRMLEEARLPNENVVMYCKTEEVK